VKGPDDPELTAHVRSDYASTLYLRGELAEAEPHMERAHRSVQGMSAMIVPRMDINLGRLRTQQGRFAEANRHLAGLEPELIKLFSAGSWMHAFYLARLGELYLAEGRVAEARQIFTRLWTDIEEPADALANNRASAQLGLVRLALAEGDVEAARTRATSLLRDIETSKARRDMPDEEAAANMLLGAATVAGGDAQAALTLLQFAVRRREAMDAPQSLWLMEARCYLVRGLAAVGDVAGAKREVASAEAALRAQPQAGPQYHRLLADARRAVVETVPGRHSGIISGNPK
jgi:tetratricopeptide (TPR) repeat protein